MTTINRVSVSSVVPSAVAASGPRSPEPCAPRNILTTANSIDKTRDRKPRSTTSRLDASDECLQVAHQFRELVAAPQHDIETAFRLTNSPLAPSRHTEGRSHPLMEAHRQDSLHLPRNASCERTIRLTDPTPSSRWSCGSARARCRKKPHRSGRGQGIVAIRHPGQPRDTEYPGRA